MRWSLYWQQMRKTKARKARASRKYADFEGAESCGNVGGVNEDKRVRVKLMLRILISGKRGQTKQDTRRKDALFASSVPSCPAMNLEAEGKSQKWLIRFEMKGNSQRCCTFGE